MNRPNETSKVTDVTPEAVLAMTQELAERVKAKRLRAAEEALLAVAEAIEKARRPE